MTERAPLVSVVMPVRNGERWLAAAIDSLLAQTLTDIEIIVVDDGSEDATPAILERYLQRDPRIRLLRQDALGLVDALNRGLEQARAPLIARLDADDVALPERLRHQSDYMRSNIALGLLGSWAEKIDEHGKTVGGIKPAVDSQALASILLHTNPIVHSTVMMRTDLVRRLGGYREAFRGAEDYDLWLRISEEAMVANLPEVLIQYRWHSDNVSNRYATRQAFSARLARRATILRRSLKADPAANLSFPPDWHSIDANGMFYAQDAKLYRALDLADPTLHPAHLLAAADLSPILCLETHLTHQERKLASLAVARYLRSVGWRFDALQLLIRLAKARPKTALRAVWYAISAAE